MNFISLVKQYVENECKKPGNNYGYDLYRYHLRSAVKYAEFLCSRYKNIDKQSVIIAEWLHDIGSVVYGREDHHITGAKIAEQLLKKYNYPLDRIELVKRCILNHRGSRDRKRISLEEKIVAEADTLSNFDSIAGIFKAAYVYEKLDQAQAQSSVRTKLYNKYKKLQFFQSRKIARPKYEAVMVLLKK